MSYDLSVDLKATRRKAGLTQGDCAHFLGLHRSRISLLELGKREPTLRELCLISVLYELPADRLLAAYYEAAIRELSLGLETLPRPRRRWIATFNRQNTLERLALRLDQLSGGADAA